MPSSKVDSVIRAFKAKFQSEQGVYIPMALRQESTDVVFVSLLEEDRPPFEMPGPMAGYEPDGQVMPQGQGDPMMMLEELLGASMEGAEGGMPPMQPGPAPGDPAEPQGQDLAAMMGMM
jgi:hypothetical protein